MSVPDFSSRGVYFIRQGSTGPIKIGWSKNIPRRIREIGCGWAEEGELLAVLPSLDERPEKLLHKLLARDRIRGEWFEPSCWVMAVVAGVRALNDGGSPAEVPGVLFSQLPESMKRAARMRPKKTEF